MPDGTRENRRRIIDLEQDVGGLKVDMGKIEVGFDASERRAEERYEATATAQTEIKDLIQKRIDVDTERERSAREVNTKAAEWRRSLVNPQTVVIVLAIILGLFGVKMSDISIPAAADQTIEP